jgi:SpoVK/Ycf46/Vps4 family AAA+-type ATPase
MLTFMEGVSGSASGTTVCPAVNQHMPAKIEAAALSRPPWFLPLAIGCTRAQVVFATNRKRDLDAALLSRCSVVLPFELPNQHARALIWRLLAKHLSPSEVCTVCKDVSGAASVCCCLPVCRVFVAPPLS